MKFYHDKLKKIRKKKKIRADAFSSKMGISRSTLWLWEKGKGSPTEDKIRKLARELDVSVDLISDLNPSVPISNNLEQSQINNLLYSFTSVNMNERKNTQKFQIQLLEKQFNELNQIVSIIETFLNTIQIMFYAKDISSKYIVANHAFLKNVSMKTDYKVIGACDDSFFPKKEAIDNEKEDRKVINTGETVYREGFIPGSRKKKWGIITKVPIYDSLNKIAGILGYFTDITKRKEAELINENLIKVMNMLDEAVWIARKAEAKPEGGIIFKDFLFNVKSRLIKRIFQEETDNLNFKEIWEHLQSVKEQDNRRKRHNLENLINNGYSEAYLSFKDHKNGKTLNLTNNIYYDKKTDLCVGILKEDKYLGKIEAVKEKLREQGVDENIIKNAFSD